MKQNFYKYLILLTGLLILLPFIVLSFFGYYSLDDYLFGVSARNFGYIDFLKGYHTEYNGRYFTTTMMWLIGPHENYEELVVLTPLLIFSGMSMSLFYLLKELFKNSSILKIEIIFLSIIVLLPILSICDVTGEIFYWPAGSLGYGLCITFFFTFIRSLIKFYRNDINNKQLLFFCLNYIFLIGSNETIIIISNLLLATLFIIYIFKYRKLDLKLCVFSAIGVIFTLIVFLAPGNTKRLNTSESFFTFTVKNNVGVNSEMTYNYLMENITNWITNPILIISNIFFFLWLISKKIKPLSNYAIFIVVVGLITLFLAVFPTFYALGWSPPDRTKFDYLVFFICLDFFSVAILYSFYHKLSPPLNNLFSINNISKCYFIVFLMLMFFFKNNVNLAYKDIYTGTAYEYKLGVNDRIQTLKSSALDSVEIYNIHPKPEILFHDLDARFANEEWIVGSISNFYHHKKVHYSESINSEIINERTFKFDAPEDLVDYAILKDTAVYLSSHQSLYMNQIYEFTLNYAQQVAKIPNYESINGLKIRYHLYPKSENLIYQIFLVVKNMKSDKTILVKNWPVNLKNVIPNQWREMEANFDLYQKSAFDKDSKIYIYMHNENKAPMNFDDFTFTYYK